MKTFKQIIFVVALVVGMAFTASAQKDDPKQLPPKNPPTVNPGDKPKPPRDPRDKPPKGDNRPKKPEMSFYLASGKGETDLA